MNDAFSGVTVIFPERSEDRLSDALRDLTRRIREAGYDTAGGAFGGADGYGAWYEDEVFMMHPYCWCERDDCPWCAGCQNGYPEPPHADDCYHSRLQLLKQKHGERTDWGGVVFWSVPLGCAEYNEGRTALCEEMGLDPEYGSEIHCTCWAEGEAKRQYDACGCDWHKGRGPFRFGPATDAPNFWHKPTNLRVRWYKWIGRSMEVDSPTTDDPAEIVNSLHPHPPIANP